MKKENKSKWSFAKTTITELNTKKMQKIIGGVYLGDQNNDDPIETTKIVGQAGGSSGKC